MKLYINDSFRTKKKNSKVLAACVRKKKLSFVEKILRNSKKKPKQLKLVDLFL